MDLQSLKQFVRDCIKSHPDRAEEIKDFYFLALDEIEDGGSEQHEYSLAVTSIKELLKPTK